MYACVCDTDRDEHAQLALASIFSVDIELNGEAGGDAAGQPGAAGSYFAGIVSGQNPKLEGTERSETVKTDQRYEPQQQADIKGTKITSDRVIQCSPLAVRVNRLKRSALHAFFSG